MTNAAASNFNSAAYDSAFFTVRGPTGDRLVLTTGKEAVLRGQRGLLRWLRATTPEQRDELVMLTGDAGVHRINWAGSGTTPSPGDKVFSTDAALGPITLAVLERFADANGMPAEADAVMRLTRGSRDPITWHGALLALLAAGWGTASIGLPTSLTPPPVGRRPPTPRGQPRPLPEVASQIRISGGGPAVPVITRDGAATSDVSYVPPPSSIQPAGQAPGPVAIVERSHDSLAPLTQDEPGPRSSTGAILLAAGVAVAVVGGFVWMSGRHAR
jgi:hypothetical protein